MHLFFHSFQSILCLKHQLQIQCHWSIIDYTSNIIIKCSLTCHSRHYSVCSQNTQNSFLLKQFHHILAMISLYLFMSFAFTLASSQFFKASETFLCLVQEMPSWFLCQTKRAGERVVKFVSFCFCFTAMSDLMPEKRKDYLCWCIWLRLVALEGTHGSTRGN